MNKTLITSVIVGIVSLLGFIGIYDAYQNNRLVNLGAVPVTQVVNGGTGSTTLSGILIGNGTASVNTITIGNGLTLLGTNLSSNGSSIFKGWQVSGNPTYLTPTTTIGIIVSASSTISALTVTNGTTTNSTSTNSFVTNLVTTNATSTNLSISSRHISIGNNQAYITGTTSPAFRIASTTLDAMGKSFNIATSTFLLRNNPEAIKLIGFYCTASTTGTALVRFSHDNGNATETSTCSSGGFTLTTTNNTWTSYEAFNVQASSTAGAVNSITVTTVIQKTSD